MGDHYGDLVNTNPTHKTRHVDPILDDWISWLLRRQLSPLTIDVYVSTVMRYMDGADDWKTADTDTIEKWCARARPRTRHPSAATVNRDMAALSSLYKWAHSRGHLQQNPTLGAVTPRDHRGNPHPPEDDVWIDVWNHAIGLARVGLGLGYYVGLRRNEVMSLKWQHVDLKRQRLVDFPRKGGGTDVMHYGECVAVIAERMPLLLPGGADAFHSQLEVAWERAHERASDGMMPSLGGKNWFYRAVYKWQADAGHANSFSPHALRHGFVTNLLRADVPVHLVSRMANHGSIETTMRYVKAGGAELRDWRLRTS